MQVSLSVASVLLRVANSVSQCSDLPVYLHSKKKGLRSFPPWQPTIGIGVHSEIRLLASPNLGSA